MKNQLAPTLVLLALGSSASCGASVSGAENANLVSFADRPFELLIREPRGATGQCRLRVTQGSPVVIEGAAGGAIQFSSEPMKEGTYDFTIGGGGTYAFRVRSQGPEDSYVDFEMELDGERRFPVGDGPVPAEPADEQETVRLVEMLRSLEQADYAAVRLAAMGEAGREALRARVPDWRDRRKQLALDLNKSAALVGTPSPKIKALYDAILRALDWAEYLLGEDL